MGWVDGRVLRPLSRLWFSAGDGDVFAIEDILHVSKQDEAVGV